MITFISNHIEQALDRLLLQYKNKPRIVGLISAIVDQVQKIENAAEPLTTQRGIETSEGVQLDKAGDIIGAVRIPGESDSDYRARIKVKIVQNLNEGTAEEVITAISFFLGIGMFWYLEVYPAEVDVLVPINLDPTEVEGLVNDISEFLPAGVSLGSFGEYDPDNPFIFNGGNGLGDVNDSEVGGLLANVYTGNGIFYLVDDEESFLESEDEELLITE